MVKCSQVAQATSMDKHGQCPRAHAPQGALCMSSSCTCTHIVQSLGSHIGRHQASHSEVLSQAALTGSQQKHLRAQRPAEPVWAVKGTQQHSAKSQAQIINSADCQGNCLIFCYTEGILVLSCASFNTPSVTTAYMLLKMLPASLA